MLSIEPAAAMAAKCCPALTHFLVGT